MTGRRAGQPPVLCLLGPTASGKTEVAIRLSETFPVDIISVDSAMVYRGLDIGSAKPDAETLRRAPHALVDIMEPENAYSVAQFLEDATHAIKASHAQGRIPLLAGGTMLYFNRLLGGLADLPAADHAVRAGIDAEAASLGWPVLHERLKSLDPDAALRIAPNDAQRIQRALEVHALTGQTITALQRQNVTRPAFDFHCLALINDDRARLHQAINGRLDRMIAEGLIAEVEGLLARPRINRDLPSMRAVGYRQIAAYLAGDLTRDQAIADAKTATRRLAKRQFTWLRAMDALHRVDPLETGFFDRISIWTEQIVE
ncbi:MAG: tRNA (adenosine(37)-N6)-dimethylallyltransferase MiaA [Pseudomonadota bacterium]